MCADAGTARMNRFVLSASTLAETFFATFVRPATPVVTKTGF
eukprot:CAMPEP_0196717560 /NCGR_PEP_ID=MMETSP1091-20130531/916_1 /TAXON_ID=302021 /ORGANISM="Rhodomonas sp., Strain CCMP768" /LENGTH=41 /DNA_ID= /DNA_START= /DNA_END= /DNA_ORIENTATION=